MSDKKGLKPHKIKNTPAGAQHPNPPGRGQVGGDSPMCGPLGQRPILASQERQRERQHSSQGADQASDVQQVMLTQITTAVSGQGTGPVQASPLDRLHLASPALRLSALDHQRVDHYVGKRHANGRRQQPPE